jgi:hypothetical protein
MSYPYFRPEWLSLDVHPSTKIVDVDQSATAVAFGGSANAINQAFVSL